jgi:hypothetical protein
MNDPGFRSRTLKVFQKIFDAMRIELTPRVFEESLLEWAGLQSGPPLKEKWQFPSLQLDYELSRAQGLFPDKLQSVEYLMGLQHSQSGSDHDVHDLPQFAFQFSYLIFFSKLEEDQAKIKLPDALRHERNAFFTQLFRRVRGYRDNKEDGKAPPIFRTQVGILPFDLPELEAPAHSQPWKHWARDYCINKADGSAYARSITYRQMPLSCGVSGTTNLALWSLFAFKIELSKEGMLDFLLADWVVLCYDGGHSLQEVLTAAKLLSTYLDLKMQTSGYCRDHFSSSLVESLSSATENVLPIGLEDDPSADLKSASSYSLKEIEKEILKYSHQIGEWNNDGWDTPTEQKIRKEVEFYFEHAGKTVRNSKFGAYYDSIFSQIQDSSFAHVREITQNQLLHYVESQCSKPADHISH